MNKNVIYVGLDVDDSQYHGAGSTNQPAKRYRARKTHIEWLCGCLNASTASASRQGHYCRQSARR